MDGVLSPISSLVTRSIIPLLCGVTPKRNVFRRVRFQACASNAMKKYRTSPIVQSRGKGRRVGSHGHVASLSFNVCDSYGSVSRCFHYSCLFVSYVSIFYDGLEYREKRVEGSARVDLKWLEAIDGSTLTVSCASDLNLYFVIVKTTQCVLLFRLSNR